ncbi:MAG: isochorismate synthase [Prevotella sp.]|nr:MULTISPECIES: isochorismate synthase [unclassified Prevotella]MCH3986164.1 isochorismate synthase [Prevotella sp.]MCH4186783.1 isochorismate synthase [Prevotella sp.]MCH4215324.1 isochorismate synthase [Prevotella sp.]MCH4251324.1 isochorismate synthase [Prevotella sp.]MCI1290950.1 isochorismate synthase [Prevotella sp.]
MIGKKTGRIIPQLMNSYAIYRLPGKDECVCLSSQSQPVLLDSLSDLNGRKGFVIAPFVPSDKNPILLLVPDHTEILKIRTGKEEVPVEDHAVSSGKGRDVSGERDRYQKTFMTFHDRLASGEFEKIVLARRARHYQETAPDPEDLFQKACQRYPHLFVALVSTRQSGTWLMATPEILLKGDGRIWQTMALAGTRRADTPYRDISPGCRDHALRNVLWTEKNVHEQALVAGYVETCIRRFSIRLEKTQPYTTRAADLLHLRSDFRFTLPDQDHLGDLLDALHPTPAVCGLPKEKARRFIVENEGAPRRYYSGFQGPLSFQGETHLYVSLRCMQITEQYCDLYAGGGLLKDSYCENEWQETEAKLGTMERLL